MDLLWSYSNLTSNWASLESDSLINRYISYLFGIKAFALLAHAYNHINESTYIFIFFSLTQQLLNGQFLVLVVRKICVWNANVYFLLSFPFNMLLLWRRRRRRLWHLLACVKHSFPLFSSLISCAVQTKYFAYIMAFNRTARIHFLIYFMQTFFYIRCEFCFDYYLFFIVV